MHAPSIIAILCLSLSIIACSKKPQFYTEAENTKTAYPTTESGLLKIEGNYDKRVGFSPKRPIFLGLLASRKGEKTLHHYLNSLVFEDGESLQFKRLRSCCPFQSHNVDLNFFRKYSHGLLEEYEVTHPSTKQKTLLYFNVFDESAEPLRAPRGFKAKSEQ
ncbi:MAG: hypothetical protein LAT68_08180 [Cyclobacteriaceae bacterium]|nr:hypothetical protein [Cyclobacteriaceae bacterium]